MEVLDYLKPTFISISVTFLWVLYRWWKERQDSKEVAKIYEKIDQRESKKLLNDREAVHDLTLSMNEKEFWEIIGRAQLQSGDTFKNQVGLLIDKIRGFDSHTLLTFYLRFSQLLRPAHNERVLNAYQIIDAKLEINDYIIFLEWIVCRGELYYNNYIHNPDLIANTEINSWPDVGIDQTLHEVYYQKTSKLLPDITSIEFEEHKFIEDQALLAQKFPRLWDRYIENDS